MFLNQFGFIRIKPNNFKQTSSKLPPCYCWWHCTCSSCCPSICILPLVSLMVLTASVPVANFQCLSCRDVMYIIQPPLLSCCRGYIPLYFHKKLSRNPDIVIVSTTFQDDLAVLLSAARQLDLHQRSISFCPLASLMAMYEFW